MRLVYDQGRSYKTYTLFREERWRGGCGLQIIRRAIAKGGRRKGYPGFRGSARDVGIDTVTSSSKVYALYGILAGARRGDAILTFLNLMDGVITLIID